VAELQQHGIEAKDIPGGKGQFDVIRDGEVMYSKHETGRFPEHGEIVGLLS
jgi:hypothetical protein